MIIYGTKGREREIGKGHFSCPKCSAERPYVQRQVGRWFTLFFIPIFKYKTLGDYVECQVCFTAFKSAILTRLGLQMPSGEGGQATMAAAYSGPQAEPIKAAGSRPLRILGYILMLLGVLAFFIFVGPSNDPEIDTSFGVTLTLLLFCPVPLLGLGYFLYHRGREDT